jgi:hypothetical protein
VASDGVYQDDPSEAVAFLRDKVLGKKLFGPGGVEFRPAEPPLGPRYAGLARMQMANRMDLPLIPRVAIGPPKRGTIPVWVIPQRGKSPADVDQALRAAQVSTPAGKVSSATYELGFPKDTAPEQLVAFAQQAILAMGVAPGQMWQWISRGRDQMPD